MILYTSHSIVVESFTEFVDDNEKNGSGIFQFLNKIENVYKLPHLFFFCFELPHPYLVAQRPRVSPSQLDK